MEAPVSDVTIEQAKTLSRLLPALMRQLMAGENDPAANLPLGQLRVCSILRGGPRPMSALSRELGVTLSAMTQIADRMERSRLVRRVPRGDDRRIRYLELAERGEKIMRVHEEARVKRLAAVLEHLSSADREEALGTLETLIAACIATRGVNGDGNEHRLQFSATKSIL